MRFFDNNLDKIYSYDTDGNITNRFFYVNIPENMNPHFQMILDQV